MSGPRDVAVVSDVHISERRPASLGAFVRFLAGEDGHLAGASRLVLLGDLFDAWFGRRMALVPFYRRALEALAGVAARGLEVEFLAGNRDFLFDAATAREFGVAVRTEDEIEVGAGPCRSVLLHGDTLCTADVAYQRLRRVVRSAPARLAARLLPHGALSAVAGALRRRSVEAVKGKRQAVLEISRAAALEALARHPGSRHVVCGHVHEAAVRGIGVDGGALLYTLGSWSGSGGTYALVKPEGPRLVRFRARPSSSGASLDTDRGESPEPRSLGPVVTIDGPAGSGKSTIAKELARRLGYRYLDSGALYRAVTWRCLRSEISLEDESAVVAAARDMAVELRDGRTVLVDGEDVTPHLRDADVTSHVSRVAEIAGVRERLLPVQRAEAKGGSLVAEGRDMGSVVFPDAETKIFLDASLEERAGRRRAELLERGESVSLDRVVDDLRRRDEWDSSRRTAPLRRGDDFVTIDTTGLPLERVLDVVLATVRAGGGR